MKITYEEGVDLKNQYVIIANHFSYIDIPALAALNIPFKFIGKMQVNNIPVLGYIFKNLQNKIVSPSLICLGEENIEGSSYRSSYVLKLLLWLSNSVSLTTAV